MGAFQSARRDHRVPYPSFSPSTFCALWSGTDQGTGQGWPCLLTYPFQCRHLRLAYPFPVHQAGKEGIHVGYLQVYPSGNVGPFHCPASDHPDFAQELNVSEYENLT